MDNSGGSDYAKNNRTQLLAEAFQSLTTPTGGPKGKMVETYEIVDEGNAIDMQTTFTNKWPQERGGVLNKKWFHSDVKNVAYTYTYLIFDSMRK